MTELTDTDKKLWHAYMQQLDSVPAMVPCRSTQQLKYMLDLHNFTVHQAFLKFQGFVVDHSQYGTHYIVVITGKSGQISQEFPSWCKTLPMVKSITPLDGPPDRAGSWQVHLHRRSQRT